jgi:hypothetical protein
MANLHARVLLGGCNFRSPPARCSEHEPNNGSHHKALMGRNDGISLFRSLQTLLLRPFPPVGCTFSVQVFKQEDHKALIGRNDAISLFHASLQTPCYDLFQQTPCYDLFHP